MDYAKVFPLIEYASSAIGKLYKKEWLRGRREVKRWNFKRRSF
jgi:hypothetical protein